MLYDTMTTTTTNISQSPRFFDSYTAALNAGRLSQSQWKQRGRLVKDNAEPDYVVKEIKRADLRGSHPAMRNQYIVVREVSAEVVDTLGEGWAVYQIGQTEPLPTSKENGSIVLANRRHAANGVSGCKTAVNRTCNNTKDRQEQQPHHQHTLPYDAESIPKSDVSAIWASTYSTTQGVKKISRQNGVNNAERMFIPTGFNWGQYPFLEENQDQIGWIFHLLHVRRFTTYEDHDLLYGPDDFIPLKMEYLKNDIPEAQEVVGLLLRSKILERDYYEQGVKSYGYRFVDPALRHARHYLVPIEDEALSRRLKQKRLDYVKYPVLKWVRNNLHRLRLAAVDDNYVEQLADEAFKEHGRGSVAGRVKTYRDALDAIMQGYTFFVCDFAKQGRKKGFGSRRVFHNLSNLKRELRQFCRVDGEQPVEIDIKGSQLLFLAHRMKDKGIRCDDFLRCCEQDLYQHIADQGGWTRQAVKKAITQGALFAPNSSRHQCHPIKRKFDELFPAAAKYMRERKTTQHNELAKELQKAEANFIVFTVLERIRRERPTMWAVPVHDSILMLRKDADYVRTVMMEEFMKLGLHPRLEVKTLCQ